MIYIIIIVHMEVKIFSSNLYCIAELLLPSRSLSSVCLSSVKAVFAEPIKPTNAQFGRKVHVYHIPKPFLLVALVDFVSRYHGMCFVIRLLSVISEPLADFFQISGVGCHWPYAQTFFHYFSCFVLKLSRFLFGFFTTRPICYY